MNGMIDESARRVKDSRSCWPAGCRRYLEGIRIWVEEVCGQLMCRVTVVLWVTPPDIPLNVRVCARAGRDGPDI